MARLLPEFGFNVLIFDFRAHGESGGQLTTFGDRERNDVLGAVRYLRARRADDAEKIYGVGASLGAAALIAASSDDSPEGRAIDAIAVYGTFDHLGRLTRSIGKSYFFPPLRQLLSTSACPSASLQTERISPTSHPPSWPRKSGPADDDHSRRRDEIIAFDHGDSLYDRRPAEVQLWVTEGRHNDIIENEAAAKIVVEFLSRRARTGHLTLLESNAPRAPGVCLSVENRRWRFE